MKPHTQLLTEEQSTVLTKWENAFGRRGKKTNDDTENLANLFMLGS